MYDIFIGGLNLAAWVTILTVLAMFLSLIFTKLREDVAFLGVIAVLLLTGVIDTKEALSGFSSPSVVVIGVLFLVVAGLTYTGVMQWIVRYLLGTPKSYSASIVRMMVPVAAMSSILSNTTVVVMFVNIVKIWAKKLNISPSKLLIPLSYASGMGGVCTLIGTPPNMIISGMYAEETGIHLNIFSTTIPGLVCLAVGILSILAFRKLLPERKSSDDSFSITSDYTVELLVAADNHLVGETVGESGLDKVAGGQLIEVVRFDQEVISPVDPDEFIMGGDRLVFAGQIDDILSLRKSHGLVNADHPVFTVDELDKKRRLRTAYIMQGCELSGIRMSDTTFEHDHNLTLVAVARQGERISHSPRDIVLQVGDSLLLEYSPHASDIDAIRGLQIIDKSESLPSIGKKTLVSTAIMIGMIVLSSLEVLPLLQSAIIAAICMLVFRCCTPTQAMKSIDWNILMIFAGSVVMGTAIEKTGLAEAIANGMLSISGDSPLMVMTMMCAAGMFVTAFISNTAAGAIFFPIVYKAAVTMGVDPLPFIIALMIAVSSCFATPIGSPTHMLVYGPGGYRFVDFLKIGSLMSIIILVATLVIVNIVYPL